MDGMSQKREERKRQRKQRKASQVVFRTYPKLLFIWPIIAAGLLLWPVDAWNWLSPETEGWIYLAVVGVVLLTIGIDLERDHAIFWLVFFVAVFFIGRWLADVQGFTLFGDIYRGFASLDVAYDRSFGLALSLLLLPPYAVMWLWARVQHKWRITHNEFEHFSWGRADDSLARGAKRVRSTYPDLLELLLAGSGTLIVYSATGRSELRRIPHVPLIFLVRRRIDRLLESTQVTTRDRQELMESEEAAAEEAEAPAPGESRSPNEGIGGRDPL